MPDAKRAAISIAWKGGFAGLPTGKENVASLGPKLMADGGAAGKKSDEIRAEFESLDAGARLYSEAESIRGFVVAPAAELPKASLIANHVLAEPNLDARWLSRYKREREKTRLDRRTKVGHQAWMTLRAEIVEDPRYIQFWSWHPLENVADISITDVEDWYKNSISTSNLTIAVAGNASVKEAASAIDTTLAGLPDHDTRQNLQPLTLKFKNKTILVHQPAAEKSYLLIGGTLPSRNHPEDLAHQLGAGVLGRGGQSRLFKAVRSEQRAAYGFASGKYYFTKDTEMLALEGEVETEKLPQVIEAVNKTYEQFRSEGIGALEFPIAKRIMLKRTKENIEKPSTIAYLMTESDLRGFEQSRALSLLSRTEALSRKSVNQAISENFPAFTDMITVIVSPDRNAVEADCVINDFSEIEHCRDQ